MIPTSFTPDGDLCSTSRDPKWGEEARRVIEQHLGPPAQESPDGLEAAYFCPLSGQGWLSDHPNRTKKGPWPDADQDRPCQAAVVDGAVAVVEGVAESGVGLRESSP